MDFDRNIAEQLSSLQRDLGRMEGKLDSVLITVATAENNVTDADKRIRSLEVKQGFHTGIATVFGGALGFIANFFIASIATVNLSAGTRTMIAPDFTPSETS